MAVGFAGMAGWQTLTTLVNPGKRKVVADQTSLNRLMHIPKQHGEGLGNRDISTSFHLHGKILEELRKGSWRLIRLKPKAKKRDGLNKREQIFQPCPGSAAVLFKKQRSRHPTPMPDKSTASGISDVGLFSNAS